ncbi:hypothetical protein [Spiroplasma endosymbiont of Tricholauxania praeusta]|uniref:hypothetical protein n=1 Tax=Spiroplasma endosymbiont of Tricholauxania praeusta TaxID=3066296 RepID=UPI0030D3B1F2
MPKNIQNIQMTEKEYKNFQNYKKQKAIQEEMISKTKSTAKKAGKIATNHAPTLGGAIGFLAGGFGAGLTDNNPNTIFDVPVGISSAVGGAIIGSVVKQNYKANIAEKKAKRQEKLQNMLLENINNSSDSESEEEFEQNKENSLYTDFEKKLALKEEAIKKRELLLRNMKLDAKFQKQEQQLKELSIQNNSVDDILTKELANTLSTAPMTFATLNKGNPISQDVINAANLMSISSSSKPVADKQENQKPLISM